MALYHVDTSALVKLVVDEPESRSLRAFLDEADIVTSEIVLTEVPRAIRRAAARDPRLSLDDALPVASSVLDAVALVPVDRGLLLAAGALAEPSLRALDAIHVAAAIGLGPLDGFVTYDERQAAAARLAGLRTFAPSRGREDEVTQDAVGGGMRS